MTAALGLGFLLGLISSTPLGPINLQVARWSHVGHWRTLSWFVGGVLVADAATAALALWGFVQAEFSAPVLRMIGLVGGGLFVVAGLFGFLHRDRQTDAFGEAEPRAGWRLRRAFVTGLLFCGLNPAFYLFWIYGSSLQMSLGTVTALSTAAFLVGVVAGDLAWFVLFSRVVAKLRTRVSLRSWISVSSLLIAGFGAFTIGRSLSGTFHSP